MYRNIARYSYIYYTIFSGVYALRSGVLAFSQGKFITGSGLLQEVSVRRSTDTLDVVAELEQHRQMWYLVEAQPDGLDLGVESLPAPDGFRPSGRLLERHRL